MKVIAKPIDTVVWFTKDGFPNPIKFIIKNKDDSESIIKINKVIKTSEEKLAGNKMLIYNCIGVVGEKERPFELKFELSTCRWMLFKI